MLYRPNPHMSASVSVQMAFLSELKGPCHIVLQTVYLTLVRNIQLKTVSTLQFQ